MSSLRKSSTPSQRTETETFISVTTEGPKKNSLKAILFAFLSAICYTMVNFILAFISDLGPKELYPCWVTCFIGWACFHVYAGCKQEGSFFQKRTSPYYRLKEGTDDEYVLFWKSFLGPLLFTAAQFPGQTFIGLTF
mmetsp:Transcript_34511/g.52806  ORF Transcript_34511/g.52806 Transcript_34511/m.52806 type:complete len:137 (-) Transcript_34511:132-542(-)